MSAATDSVSSQHGYSGRRFITQQDLEKGLGGARGCRLQHPDTTHFVEPELHLPEAARSDVSRVSATVEDHQASRVSSTSTLAQQDQDEGEKTRHSLNQEEAHKARNDPAPKYPYKWMNVLRWEWLSVYRRLNLTVLLINLIIIIVFAAQGKLVRFDPGAMSTALAANITTAILFRQEYVVNVLFLIFGCCRPSWPLWIRRIAAKIYHFGGVHSGAGMASVIWLALFDMSLGIAYRNSHLTRTDIAIITITGALNFLLCCVVLSSYPTIRERYHNIWELIHRYGGWLSIGLFWANFVLLTDQNRRSHRPAETIIQMFITSPTFWMLFVVTICLILPWLRLRKVEVRSVEQSKYAIRLHFTYTNLPLCAAPRLSNSPLMEWHSFAGIPHEDGRGFSILVSGVGDWTKKLIARPPKKLWVRGIPVRGVLHVAPIFKKIILVATGSGIGPVLSLLYARDVRCRILWCTRDPESTYQPDVLTQVIRADPHARIISRLKGQRDPDLGKLAYDMHQESGAEAVFIISNKEGCYKARIWLESRGIVVFTPIFDS